MRRGIKFSKKAYLVLGLTAFFNLSSIVFDQLVVQHQDKIRVFDSKINNHKLEINSLLYAHKVFDELNFKVHFSAEKMIGETNYLVKSINYFNSNLPKKISDVEVEKIKKIYIEKTKNLAKNFKITLYETKRIFYKILEDPTLIKFLNQDRQFDSKFLPNENITKLKKYFDGKSWAGYYFDEKIVDEFLSKYNFSAKTEDDQLSNYPIYKDFYNEIYDYNRQKNAFYFLSQGFRGEFNKSFSTHTIMLEDYNNLQNIKNYLILTSILFQIIGLVFLMILFRVLILENK